tara:strand:- start:139 stop:540 length:402 start_codon:yes stop_codon:yes gene_type:complete
LKKNIKPGKNRLFLFFLILIFSFNFFYEINSAEKLDGVYTDLKVLDKISSKNILVKIKNGEEVKHKDLLIKSIKCKNSGFDDNPEIMAYIQVRDLTNKDKNDVFVFNNWMFSSSPSITPFDHPVYDIWLVGCY